MSLIMCSRCNAAVSSHAKGCIVCGGPLQLNVGPEPIGAYQPTAKRRKTSPSRRWALALAALAVLALAGTQFSQQAGEALQLFLH